MPLRVSHHSKIRALRLLFLVLFFFRYDFHRDEANYHLDVYVDYLDQDEEDYFRFRRVEKQLAS
ncbi:MAG: hypothetical protein WA639_21185 [Candidatus Acidiferrum sp.]